MAQADFITIVDSPAQHPLPAKPPERLSLPVRLTVNELRINRVALAKDGARYEAGPVIASARAEPQLWSAQVKSLQSALGTAAAELQVVTSCPFALKGALSLTQKEPAYNAQARISGTLERIDIQSEVPP
jgi:hypothetical protein